jgi:hypothetical protein
VPNSRWKYIFVYLYETAEIEPLDNSGVCSWR